MTYIAKERRIDLQGSWKFQMDEEKCGLEEQWFRRPLRDTIHIPGILQAQGYGEDIRVDTAWMSGLHDNLWYIREEYSCAEKGKVQIPFLSQPPKHYEGYAWYQKSFAVTQEKVYFFRMECVRWRTKVWLNGEEVGEMTALCGHHRYNLGFLTKGSYTITVLVDNSYLLPYRPDGHGVSDALGATWNGMAGDVCVYQVPGVYIRQVKLSPIAQSRILSYNIIVRNETGQKIIGELEVNGHSYQQWFVPGETRVIHELPFDKEVPLWDEYHPHLEEFSVRLKVLDSVQEWEEKFGFREIAAKIDGFYINQRPTYMRGTHFGGDFPLTGYPCTDVEEWKRIIGICKDWGMNFIRFHSYCPPEAAFLAADELGFYLQVECGMWNVFESGIPMLDILKQETDRILRQFGNHPSFVMLSPSNEPGGEWFEPLKEWVSYCKSHDDRRLYTIQSGWPYPMPPAEISGTDYVYFHRSGYGPLIGGTIRSSEGWYGKDYKESLDGIQYPVISHELGQWCAYPDFTVIDKFNGYLEPGNYLVFQERARKMGLLSKNKELAYASGRWQVEMYKEDFEANFRTPHIYGFEMLDLHDYLGQGTALVGVLDAFWEEKGYVKPEEFRQFCSETVLLLRIKERIFTQDREFSYSLEAAHFGREVLSDITVHWQVEDKDRNCYQEGSWKLDTLSLGKNLEIGWITLDLQALPVPNAYTVKAEIIGTDVKNTWDIWVYAKDVSVDSETVVHTDSLKEACDALEEGKKVLFTPPLSIWNFNCPLLNKKPIFWNAQMGPKWSRGVGLWIEEEHPALAMFPTKGYGQWQWADLMKEARGINLAGFPKEWEPIVQPIDEWNRSFRLGLLLEAAVGKGKLFLTGIPLKKADTPIKRQLLKSILSYMESEEFIPKQEISNEEFLSPFQDTAAMIRLGVRAWIPGSEHVNLSALLDGNPNSCIQIKSVRYPLTICLEWEQETEIAGLTYVPVQNRRDHRGDIREYEVRIKTADGYRSIAQGAFTSSFAAKNVVFSEKVVAKHLEFIVKSGFDCDSYQEWTQTNSGWERKIDIWKEDMLILSCISILTPEGIFEVQNYPISYGEGTTATAEIEEN